MAEFHKQSENDPTSVCAGRIAASTHEKVRSSAAANMLHDSDGF